MTRTTEQRSGLGCDHFDGNRTLLRFGSDVTTRCDNEERICLRISVFEIESLEKDDGGCNDSLAEGNLSA